MIFKNGQKVICVRGTSKANCNCSLRKGAVYTVESPYQCACGSHQVALKEIPEVLLMRCACSHTANRRQTYYNWRFIPLDLLTNFISAPEIKLEKAEIDI